VSSVIIRSGTVVLPEVGTFVGDVWIEDGVVRALGRDLRAQDAEYIEAGGCLVMPGFIDPHVHLGNYNEFAQDCLTESRAAAHGGVTTVMTHVKVLRHRPEETSYLDVLEEVSAAVAASSIVDVGAHLAISTDAHLDELEAYHELGIRSFKFYMGYRSDPRARRRGSVGVGDGFIYEGMRRIGRLPGALALVHCENEEIASYLASHRPASTPSEFLDWADTRPPLIEAEAVQRAAYLAAEADCPFYVVHLSSAKALDAARRMRSLSSRPLWIEGNLHHLTMTRSDGAALEASALAKVSPPLRESGDIEALWGAVRAGELHTVGTDHCCLEWRGKTLGTFEGEPGFPALDCLASLLISQVIERRLPLELAARITSYNAARIFGLYPRKGTLLPGADGDVVLIRTGEPSRVLASENLSAAKFTPYDGRPTQAVVEATLVRGRVVYDRATDRVEKGGWGRLVGARPPTGEALVSA